jgi:recombination protein RecT
MNDLPTQDQKPTHPMVQFKRDMEAVVARELDMLDDKAKSRMKSAAIVAVTKDPELLLADRQSFMGAIRMCAQHGVTPDGNEATLQVYNSKAKGPNGQEIWVKKVTYLPMIRGIVNRVMRSGKIRLFRAEVVYEGESFTIDQTNGFARPIHDFDPMRRGEDKDIIGAYSVAIYDDTTIDCEAMPRKEIEKVRASAKTKNVWDGWFSEKAKVAVMKRHSKRLPLSAEDMDFILNRDETDFDQSPRDVTPEERPKGPNLAQRLAAQPAEVSHWKQVDGEILPDGEPTPPISTDMTPAHWTAAEPEGFFPGSDAFKQGANAAKDGILAEECPFDQGTEQANDWLAGHYQCRRAMQ